MDSTDVLGTLLRAQIEPLPPYGRHGRSVPLDERERSALRAQAYWTPERRAQASAASRDWHRTYRVDRESGLIVDRLSGRPGQRP